MKNKDQILLEDAYSKIVLKENSFDRHGYFPDDYGNEPLDAVDPKEIVQSDDNQWYFDDNGEPPYNVKYSNRTFNFRGKEVLIKQEFDNMEDDEWYYLSLVDPKTKERVFNDVKEDEIKRMFF